jgi:hypothetical protein
MESSLRLPGGRDADSNGSCTQRSVTLLGVGEGRASTDRPRQAHIKLMRGGMGRRARETFDEGKGERTMSQDEGRHFFGGWVASKMRQVSSVREGRQKKESARDLDAAPVESASSTMAARGEEWIE